MIMYKIEIVFMDGKIMKATVPHRLAHQSWAGQYLLYVKKGLDNVPDYYIPFYNVRYVTEEEVTDQDTVSVKID